MATTKKLNYKYLLSLYARVDEFLSNQSIVQEEVPDSIVSFCIVVEKILKLKLHRRNPFLVFDISNTKATDDMISVIALKKEKDIETAKINTIMNRFEIVYKKTFTPDEFEALKYIYGMRNSFIHGYKSDDRIIFDAEDIIKKMGTLWEKISKIALSLFGKENIKNGKPKKKYSEKELEQVLAEEVRKMIKPLRNKPESFLDIYSPGSYVSGGKCPRCGSYTFSLGGTKSDWISTYDLIDTMHTGLPLENVNNLYKCKKCNLELTEKQYEIAKKILNQLQ